MNREITIEAIAAASELRNRDGQILFANRFFHMIEDGKIPGLMLTTDDVQRVMKENLAMRKAISFATAPDLWILRDTNIWEYPHPERGWYVNVLNAAIKKDE